MTDVNLTNESIDRLGDRMSRVMETISDNMITAVRGMTNSTAGGMFGMPNSRPGGSVDSMKSASSELDLLIRTLKKNRQTLTAYEQYMLKTATRQKQAMDEEIKNREENTDSIEDNTDAVEDNTKEQERQATELRRAVNATQNFVKGLVAGQINIKGFTQAVDEFQQAYRLGMNWNPALDALNGALMGMDPKSMMEYQAQFRRVSNTMTGGIGEFNDMIAASQNDVKHYTGTMAAAAQLMGNLYDISASIGINMDSVASSADGLYEQFRRMQSVTSITSDQFVDLTKRLSSNADIQHKLLGLNELQRGQYMQSLVSQQTQLQVLGLQKEVAEGMIAANEKRSTAPGIERLTNSIQFRQLLGSALKWSAAEAADASELLFTKRTLNDEEAARRLGYSQRYTSEIERMSRGGTQIGVTTGNEIQLDAMRAAFDKTGVLSADAQAALQGGAAANQATLRKQSLDIQSRDSGTLGDIAEKVTMISDVMGGWRPSMMAAMVSGIVGVVLARTGVVSSILGSILPGRGGAGGAGGGPGGGAGGGRVGGLGAIGGRAMLGGGIAIAGMTASSFIDPSANDGADRKSLTIAQQAMMYGSMGAGAGAAVHPIAALVLGIVGAAGGAYKGLLEYQEQYDTRMSDMSIRTSAIMNVEAIRIDAEKRHLEEQIENLETMGTLTDKQKATLASMNTELDNLDARSRGNQLAMTANNHLVSSRTLGAMLSEKDHIGSGSELGSRLSMIDSIAKRGGADINAEQVFSKMLGNAMLSAPDGDLIALQRVMSGLQSGNMSDVDIPSSISPAIQQMLSSTIATAKSSVDGTSLAGDHKYSEIMSEAQRMRTKAEEADQKLAAMRKEMDDFNRAGTGYALPMDTAEMERLQQASTSARETADALTNAAKGTIPLNVALQPDSLKQLSRAFYEAVTSGPNMLSGPNAPK